MEEARQPEEHIVVLVKPDGVTRGLAPVVVSAYRAEGFHVLRNQKHPESDPHLPSLFEKHYREHREKPFFNGLVSEMSRGPIVVYHLYRDGFPGSHNKSSRDICARLRDEYKVSTRHNTVHCSDSEESALREIGIWFTDTVKKPLSFWP